MKTIWTLSATQVQLHMGWMDGNDEFSATSDEVVHLDGNDEVTIEEMK